MNHYRIRHRIGYWTIATAWMFLCVVPTAQSQRLFDSHDVLQVTIEAPLKTLQKVRSDVDYLDGKFSYADEIGAIQTFDLKLRARGRFRRQKDICGFPPIRLNFPAGQVKGSVLDGQDKLKLITHCQNRRTQSEQYVLREYLAYRILQTLTDRSFSSRLLRVTYVDTENNRKPMVKYGFVIEDDDVVGDRIGLAYLETDSLKYKELDARHTNLINVFQFLIGNTDFSLIRGPDDDDCCHNAVPYSDTSGIISVPYDFDFSGLVNAPYASPNPRFKIKSVLARVYRGQCSSNNLLPDTIAYFQSKRSELFRLVDEIVDLNKKNRRQVTRFLNAFFEDLANEKTVQRKFVNKCY